MTLKLIFSLNGTNISPKEITKIVGISPNVELLEGERNKKLNLPRANRWTIWSSCESEKLLDHWNEIGAQLVASQDHIREIALTGSAKITIGISGTDKRLPSIKIPSDMSLFAGVVNAIIDIDHLPTKESS